MDEPTFTDIENAAGYKLASNGRVYNFRKGGQRKALKRFWRAGVWQTSVKADDGKYRWYRHDRNGVVLPHTPADEYRPLAQFPDYCMTPDGHVWKMAGLHGRYGDRPFLVTVQYRGVRAYVRLRDRNNRVCNRAVSTLHHQTYPELQLEPANA